LIKAHTNTCIREFLRHIPDNFIDLILIDPDYGIGKIKSTFNGIPDAFIISELNRVLRPNGNFLMFGSGMFSAKMKVMNEAHYKQDLIWDKGRTTDFLNSNRKMLPCHEDIMLFCKTVRSKDNPLGCKRVYNPEKWKGKAPHSIGRIQGVDMKGTAGNELYGNYTRMDTVTDMKFPRTIIRGYDALTNTKKLYPTEKPVPLLRYLIRTYSNPGDSVLDGYCGSGSTGEAAELEGRHSYLNDISERAHKISTNRLSLFMTV
jgi:DNA modification methylase